MSISAGSPHDLMTVTGGSRVCGVTHVGATYFPRVAWSSMRSIAWLAARLWPVAATYLHTAKPASLHHNHVSSDTAPRLCCGPSTRRCTSKNKNRRALIDWSVKRRDRRRQPLHHTCSPFPHRVTIKGSMVVLGIHDALDSVPQAALWLFLIAV